MSERNVVQFNGMNMTIPTDGLVDVIFEVLQRSSMVF